jgi:hypothetical protein
MAREQSGAALAPRLVLVQDGEVVESQPAGSAAVAVVKRIADETRRVVIVYEVDHRLPPPPPPGTPVDPAAMGWTEVFRHPNVPAVTPMEPPLQLGDLG